MSSSSRVDHSVAVGSSRQNSIWCYSGIDLFVCLQIDSTDSDGPRSTQPQAWVVPSQSGAEKSLIVHNLQAVSDISYENSQTGSRSDNGKPYCSEVAPKYVNEYMMPTEVLSQECGHIGVRGFVVGAVSPVVGQRYDSQRLLKCHHHPDERFPEYYHVNPGDPGGFHIQFEYGLPADRNLVTGRDCLAVRLNPDEQNCEYQQRNASHENEFFCSENRRWSPQLHDYYWVPLEMDTARNGDPDEQVAGCNGGRTHLEEESSHVCASSPSCLLIPSENDSGGRMQLQLHGDSSPPTIMSNGNSREIEICDEAAISAAYLLLKMSTDECRRELKDLSALEESHVYNLGSQGASNEGTLYNIAKKTHATTLRDVTVRDTRNALQPGSRKMKLSAWSNDDRYIPRLARRAKARLRGGLRKSKFSTTIAFGNSKFDEDSDCVLFRTPRTLLY